MNKQPYQILWDDPLWLAYRTAAAIRPEENRQKQEPDENAFSAPPVSPAGTSGQVVKPGYPTTELAADTGEIRQTNESEPENPVEPEWIPLPRDSAYTGARGMNGVGPDDDRAIIRPENNPGTGFPTIPVDLFKGIPDPVNVTANSNRTAGPREYKGRSGSDEAGNDETTNFAALSENDRTEIRRIVDDKLSELRVYVLESDISDAQQAVKSVVEQASF